MSLLMKTTFSNSSCDAAQCSIPSIGALDLLVRLLVQSIFTQQCNISPKESWPRDHAEVAVHEQPQTYDFVIVGGGSAGSVVASRLSENPQFNVLVLEEGTDPPQESEVPFLLNDIQGSNYTYNYIAESNGISCKSAANGRCGWISGKCLGGSGAINAMLYFRGTRSDYDYWCSTGSQGWCYMDVWPYFQKSTTPQGNETFPKGYISLNEYGKYAEDLTELFCKGSQELGVPRIHDFVEGSYIGYGNFRGTLEMGRRMSTAKGFLGRVADSRPNLKVIKNAKVIKLNFNEKGDQVTNVEVILQSNTTLTVKVAKEVILSAGTVESARLLMISGVGPLNVLNPLNIPVLYDLPVGENLQDHVAVPIFFTIPNSKNSLNLDDVYRYLKYQEGPLTSINTGSFNGFIRTNTRSAAPYPDIQLQHFTVRRGAPLGMGFLSGFGVTEQLRNFFNDLVNRMDVVMVFVILSQPKSRGSIKLRSASHQDTLLIDPGYLTAAEDIEGLLRGIKYLRRLEKSSAFQRKKARMAQVPIEQCRGFSVDSEEFWRCYIGYYSSTSSHLVGTVRMGAKNDSRACVDPRLKVKGVNNLRVADASIMPRITSCNTYGPTIMIGERAADFIKKNWA